jgi:DMSO reductase anchor subunit
MALTTLTFTMRNEGFRSQYVAPYSKAVLITAVLDEAQCIVAMVVVGIPLTAIRSLERQNVFHFSREQVPEMLLLAIEEHCDRKVREAFEKVGANLFQALEKPGPIQ